MSEISKFLDATTKNAVAFCEPKLNKKEVSQDILFWKMGCCEVLEKRDVKDFYTIRQNEKFGFSELLVNELMQFAYERGLEQGIRQGEIKGHNDAMKEVADKLGFSQDNS